jgi:FtsP/CotA-like multicopper oxidase with cupredoxin domain
VTGRQRIVLLAIAAAILVGGLVLALSGGDDPGTDSAATTPATTPAETQPSSPGETAPEEQAPPPKPKPRVEEIRMRGRAPVGEPRTLRYERGDTIRLRFASDVAEEVHIHGFDEYVDVPAGGTKTVRFGAALEGVFEVESHGSGELLAKLEIRPR